MNEQIREFILEYFKSNPNSSPLDLINNCTNPGVAAAAICVLREIEELLIVTGTDSNGVLLSVKE